MRTPSTLLAVCLLLGGVPIEALAAGDVTVTDGGGTLSIVGDGEANGLAIADKESDGIWVIVGKGGTTVNGDSSYTTVAISGDISIDLGGGDDSLKMTGGNVTGFLSVKMGTGNDKAVISGTKVLDYFAFEGNADDDKLTVKDITVADPGDSFTSSIATDNALGAGTGTDSAKIKNFVDQGLDVYLGSGDDKLTLSASTFTSSPNAHLAVYAGGGIDKTTLKAVSVPGDLSADMGAADDTLTILSCTALTSNLTGGLGTGDKLTDKGNSLGTPAPGTPSSFEY